MWAPAVVIALSLIGVLAAQDLSTSPVACPARPCPRGYRCEATPQRCPSPPRCPKPQMRCVRINATCLEPLKVGPCKAAIPRYFYRASSQQCELFSWGGCSPNGNNFLTLDDCRAACYPGHGSSCLSDSRWYQDGAIISSDPCLPCQCLNGTVSCAVIDCFFPLSCSNPITVPGQCCPVCPTELKPGVCPRPRTGICAITCQNDTSCPMAEKCCTTACGGTGCEPPAATCEEVDCPEGHYCRVLPPVTCVSGSCPSLPQCIKSGLCPAVPPTRGRPDSGTRCPVLCTSDTECFGEQRCCKGQGSGGPPCGTRCQDPIFV